MQEITDRDGAKPFLFSYSYIKDLSLFFNHIWNTASEYGYIAVAARRCFNLFIWYFEDSLPGQMTSFNGLLLHYQDIADFYIENQRFPDILLVDDIMVHGRGIAKTISHLESLVYAVLLPTGRWSINRLRRDFADAIHIYVYARNSRTLVLEERFFEHFQAEKKLYSGDLRDLSLQLSDAMTRWEIADTSFVPSVRLEDDLRNELIKLSDSGDSYGNWQCMKWYYDREKMVLAYQMYGDRKVNRISTIRFCPDRTKEDTPWVSSYTIIGKMQQNALDRLCKDVFAELKEEFSLSEDSSIGHLLLTSKAPLQQCRGQFISYIASALDLRRFIQTKDENAIRDIAGNKANDVEKIARNFGTKNDTLINVLLSVFQKSNLAERLGHLLDSTLSVEADAIFDLPFRDKGHWSKICSELSEDRCNEINNLVLDVVFRMGINAENCAFVLKEKPYLFQPESFQDYQEYYYLKLRRTDSPDGIWNEQYPDEDDEDRYGRDGAISIYSFFDLVRRRAARADVAFYASAPLFLASFAMLMDIGIMASMPQISNINDVFLPLARAGELATFHFPRMVSIFVPAFALLEAKCYRLGLSERKAVTSFYSAMRHKIDDDKLLIDKVSDSDANDIEKSKIILASLPDAEKVDKYTELLYRAGQSFRGWDFQNLCYIDYHIKRKWQVYLKEQAKHLLQLQD